MYSVVNHNKVLLSTYDCSSLFKIYNCFILYNNKLFDLDKTDKLQVMPQNVKYILKSKLFSLLIHATCSLVSKMQNCGILFVNTFFRLQAIFYLQLKKQNIFRIYLPVDDFQDGAYRNSSLLHGQYLILIGSLALFQFLIVKMWLLILIIIFTNICIKFKSFHIKNSIIEITEFLIKLCNVLIVAYNNSQQGYH